MSAQPESARGRLKLEALCVRYGARLAVRPTSLALEPGTVVGLVGPNGAGKSSLLKAIAGLLPREGRVTWADQALESLEPRTRAKLLSYLPQTPAAHWPMAVVDLVALGRLPHRSFGDTPGEEDRAAVRWAMEQTEVVELANRRLDELSGGERTRVLLARALAVRAPVLLVDEPVASLDPYHQLQIMSALDAYARQDALVVVVLHDLSLAARFCGRMLLMSEGAVVADDEPERVLSSHTLRRHYRVEPFLARHHDQPVIVPWRRLD